MDLSNTIYDITNIPYFAYIPGRTAWILFLSLALISLAIIKLWTISEKRTRKSTSAIDIAIKELTNALTSTQALELCTAASRIIRRLLSTIANEDISAFSNSELTDYISKCSDENIRKILLCLPELEGAKYRPPTETGVSSKEDYQKRVEEIISNIRQIRNNLSG